MMLPKRTLVPALLMAMAAVAPAYGQDEPAQDEMQQVFVELQQIQRQLAEIEDRAIEADASLQQKQGEVQDLVLETMFQLDPTLEGRIERLEALQGEFEDAEEAENVERMQEIMNEANELQQGFLEAQAQAMEQPEVQGAIDSFRSDLIKKMTEVEPETERLMARAEELATKLRSES